MANRVKTLFVISKSRINKKGLVPIICRLTLKGKRKPFSTGLFIEPDYWKSKQQQAIPNNKENNFINTQLGLIKQQINQAFLFLQVNQDVFDVEDVYLQFNGKSIKSEKTILEVFDLHNTRMNKLIGIEYSKATYSKFIEAKKHAYEFIKHQYNRNDILLEKINMKFLADFDYYLKSEKGHKQITINKSIQRVRKIIKLALAEGYLNQDPFIMYKPKRYERKVVFLDTKELAKLEEHTFAQIRLQQVKDMFVFCCYTGLAYAEMYALSSQHIINGFDGNMWIQMYRQKTGSKVSIPLLPKALAILTRYKEERNNEKLLPVISNQKFNSYLKEIAEVLGIEKRLTHHIARKTFATTVLLYNDVPIEIVSELLGHSKIQITQDHYAKVVQNKVSEQMQKLSEKLNKK